jgi:hypothetical protein
MAKAKMQGTYGYIPVLDNELTLTVLCTPRCKDEKIYRAILWIFSCADFSTLKVMDIDTRLAV